MVDRFLQEWSLWFSRAAPPSCCDSARPPINISHISHDSSLLIWLYKMVGYFRGFKDVRTIVPHIPWSIFTHILWYSTCWNTTAARSESLTVLEPPASDVRSTAWRRTDRGGSRVGTGSWCLKRRSWRKSVNGCQPFMGWAGYLFMYFEDIDFMTLTSRQKSRWVPA